MSSVSNFQPAVATLPRPLYVLVALLILAHTALNGIRIAILLAALNSGGGALWVGILTAMFNLLPALLAIWAGRIVDRYPLKKPLIFGCALMATGSALATVHPQLITLALAATIIGIGWLLFAAASQYAVGIYGGATNRVRAFGLMSMGFSVSSFIGPLLSGFMIDHSGFRAAFALMAVLPLIAAYCFLSEQISLPRSQTATENTHESSTRDLLALPLVRNTLIIAGFVTVGWDLYTFLVPVLGNQLKLSATQIGSALSCFALAVFAVRFGITWLIRQLGERGVMIASMALAGTVFLLFPFAGNYSVLLLLSFIIGLGLGASQPIVLSMLYVASPPGRVGEINGIRMTLISTSQWIMPLLFGMLSATTGLIPIFFIVGGSILSGSWFAKRALPRD